MQKHYKIPNFGYTIFFIQYLQSYCIEDFLHEQIQHSRAFIQNLTTLKYNTVVFLSFQYLPTSSEASVHSDVPVIEADMEMSQ